MRSKRTTTSQIEHKKGSSCKVCSMCGGMWIADYDDGIQSFSSDQTNKVSVIKATKRGETRPDSHLEGQLAARERLVPLDQPDDAAAGAPPHTPAAACCSY